MEYINKLLNQECIIAHTKLDKDPEKLYEHTNLFTKATERLLNEKNFYEIINNAINSIDNFNEFEKNIIFEMIINFGKFHDLGKTNKGFQWKIDNKIDNDYIDDKHSKYSTVIFIDYYYNKIKNTKFHDKDKKYNRKMQDKLIDLMLRLAYCIHRHHTSLTDLNMSINNKLEPDSGFLREIKDAESNINKGILIGFNHEIKIDYLDLYNIFSSNNFNDYISVYILIKLAYGILITSDFCSTYEYMNDKEFDFNIGKDSKLKNIKDKYYNTDLYKSILNYESLPEGDLNKLRSKMFLESQTNLNKNIRECLFYLEAPTGSGKTNASINLTISILEQIESIDKIKYIFPFNALVDQTYNTLSKYCNKEDIAIVNSVTAIHTGDNEDSNDMDYDTILLNKQLLNYFCTITSHVNLFNTLFGMSRDSALGLIGLCNSVIVLDEIQSYRNILWKPIIEFLERYSKILNIKLIIMSATLPKLDDLLNEKRDIVNLITDRNIYFQDDLFMKRVELDFFLLDKGKIDKSILVNTIKRSCNKYNVHRVLIECIQKETTHEVYEEVLKDSYFNDFKIFILTGDDNKQKKSEVLDYINNKENNKQKIILISTQLIEAGVDIDMDIGFKDISILDAEEQFLGRINRNCKRKGYAYFFDMDDECDVYKEDYRLRYNLHNKEYQRFLENKVFKEFYEITFNDLKVISDQYIKLVENIKNMNFTYVYTYMKLINQESISIFLNMDNKSKKIWEKYIFIKTNKKAMKYSEYVVKLSEVQEEMNPYIKSINIYNNEYKNINKNKTHYINNPEIYIEKGLINSKALLRDLENSF